MKVAELLERRGKLARVARIVVVGAGLVVTGPLVTACGRASTPEHKTDLVVFAAASLKDALGTMATEYERSQPDTHITFNFAGSQELSTQIQNGAKADVVASADPRYSDELLRLGLTDAPRLFAQSEPVLVVAAERAAEVPDFSSLPRVSRIVLGVAEAPIGRYSGQILDKAALRWGAEFRAQVESKVVSREVNVRQVLAKVILGEADAGIVYRSDVTATVRDRVAVVDIPRDLNVVARYPIAILESSEQPEAAERWIAFVLSGSGQSLLRQAGFQTPQAGSP